MAGDGRDPQLLNLKWRRKKSPHLLNIYSVPHTVLHCRAPQWSHDPRHRQVSFTSMVQRRKLRLSNANNLQRPKAVACGVSTPRGVPPNPFFSQPRCFLTGLTPHWDSLETTGTRWGSTVNTQEASVSSFDTEWLPTTVSKGFGATHTELCSTPVCYVNLGKLLNFPESLHPSVIKGE